MDKRVVRKLRELCMGAALLIAAARSILLLDLILRLSTRELRPGRCVRALLMEEPRSLFLVCVRART